MAAPAVIEPEESGTDTARLRRQVLASLTPAERADLFRPAEFHAALSFIHIWLGLGLSFAAIGPVSTLPWPARLALSAPLVVYIGTRLNALAVQVHEAAHGLIARSRRVNDLACNLLGAYWVLNDVASYRRVHHRHHAHLHEPDDPDRDLYVVPRGPVGTACAGMLLESLVGLTSVRRILAYLRVGRRRPALGSTLASPGHALGKLLAQAVVAGAFAARFGPVAGAFQYLVFWVVPLFSIMPTIIRMRIVAEHFAPELHAGTAGRFVSRTSASSLLEAYFIGASMEYHFEHHLIPSIPHRRLAVLHRLLRERGFFARPTADRDRWLSGGYLCFWARLLGGRLGAAEPPAIHTAPVLPHARRAA